MNIGLIGAGKVGTSLGKLFSEAGIHVTGYYSRSFASAKQAAEFTSSVPYQTMEELVQTSDTLFVTTPDGVLSAIIEEIAELPVKEKRICHCSGALASDVFAPARERGAKVCSVHPLVAVSDRFESWKTLRGAFFTLEGDTETAQAMEQLLHQCGAQTAVISAADKPRYHLAACVVSNLAVGLSEWGMQLLEQCGFTRDQAKTALSPLILGNAESICKKGTEQALTGPAERGDLGTIQRHMECLDRREQALYAGLTEKLCEIAHKKHPDRDDTALVNYLEGKR
jgi:predicted short-subunit dehydrogenase-like oxidoreductase (DUF2520 family)